MFMRRLFLLCCLPFAVANAIAVPLTGWLTVRFGQVRLFLASTLLFIIASWLCGLAPNMESLILFRVLQGLVAGPVVFVHEIRRQAIRGRRPEPRSRCGR